MPAASSRTFHWEQHRANWNQSSLVFCDCKMRSLLRCQSARGYHCYLCSHKCTTNVQTTPQCTVAVLISPWDSFFRKFASDVWSDFWKLFKNLPIAFCTKQGHWASYVLNLNFNFWLWTAFDQLIRRIKVKLHLTENIFFFPNQPFWAIKTLAFKRSNPSHFRPMVQCKTFSILFQTIQIWWLPWVLRPRWRWTLPTSRTPATARAVKWVWW